MNKQNLELMVTMLTEVAAGSWKVTAPMHMDPTVTGVTCTFNMWSWVSGFGMGCGFSACAVGHATLDQRFTELGWKLDNIIPVWVNPKTGTEHRNWVGVEEFFQLGDLTTEYLFMNSNYIDPDNNGDALVVTPDMVIDRIKVLMQLGEEQFVKNYQALNGAFE